MTTYFTPPTRRVRFPGRPGGLFSRLYLDSGITVLKSGSSYRSVEVPSAEELQAADIAYIGGHPYPIDSTEETALVNAGYGAYITTG